MRFLLRSQESSPIARAEGGGHKHYEKFQSILHNGGQLTLLGADPTWWKEISVIPDSSVLAFSPKWLYGGER